jgi:hypothetical protein
MNTQIIPALPAFDESVVLDGIHCRTRFYDHDGREDAGRRELRRFGHLAGSVEQPSLTLAPDPVATDLQNDAARALAEINSRRVRK